MVMINCIAIDDEPFALGIIENYALQIPFLNLIEKFSNPMDAIQLLKTQKIDLIFLDIQMPQISGINFLKSINTDAKIIFTTAYDKYAVESYDFAAADYLLKPFSFERFLKSVQKVMDGKGPVNNEKNEYIFVKSGAKYINVLLTDILYVEGLKDYVIIHLKDKKIVVLQTMKSMEEKLSAQSFIRVHRSFIVSLKKIDSVDGSFVKINNNEIPIGDSFRDAFQKALKERLF